MKDLYSVAGITRQGYHKYLHRSVEPIALEMKVVERIEAERKKHRQMGCRKIYVKAADQFCIGRDRFERIGFKYGYKVQRKRSPRKTTNGQRKIKFPNLIAGKTLTGINQVYQSDIFYYSVEGKDIYGFTIKDVYSRRLLALHFARTLKACELVKAFEQVEKERKNHSLADCIFHSDRGSQYISYALQEKVQKQYKMQPSMCIYPQENAYVERLQGILKQEYLDHCHLTLKNLNRNAQRIKYLYNYDRPHRSLKMMSPVEFESYIEKLSHRDRPVHKIYQWEDGYQQLQDLLTKKKEAKKKITTIINTQLN